MESLDMPFSEQIRHICKRPGMYTRGSVIETIAFIDGYRFGNITPISGRIFDRFVCARNAFPSNYVWGYVITACAADDKDGHRLIEENILEFLALRENMSDDQIIEYAAGQIREEGEAEEAFREFDQALLLGDESAIRPLILAHENAHVLWQGAYPNDVGDALSELSLSEPLRCIPLTGDGKRVKIIAAGWPFPIEMEYVDDTWKVNALPIIEMRMRNQKEE